MKSLVAVIVALFLPCAAFAGLPSMFGIGLVRVFLVGPVIAVVAGLILWRYCARRKRGCFILLYVLLMFIAHFFSSVAFNLTNQVLWYKVISLGGIALLKPLFLCAVATAFLIETAVYWPFVCLVLRRCGDCRKWRDTLKPSLVISSISFLLLLVFYISVCELSLLTIGVVDVADMDLPKGVSILYIAEDGKGKRLNLQTWEAEDVSAESVHQASLRVAPETVLYVDHTNNTWEAEIISYDGGGFNETVRCRNKQTGRIFNAGLQTPFDQWYLWGVTMFPDGKFIYELGNGQIVIADPERNKIAVLANGHNPVVELTKDSGRHAILDEVMYIKTGNTLIYAPWGVPRMPEKAELLDETGALALFSGLTADDGASNAKEEKNNVEGAKFFRNSVFVRRRMDNGEEDWRLLLTTHGYWEFDDGMNDWCMTQANNIRDRFEVLRAGLSRNGRSINLVCNPHNCMFNVVCRYDLFTGKLRVLGDGDTAGEESDGTILVRNKKTYLHDDNGKPLGAAWYDEWVAQDGTIVKKSEHSPYPIDMETARLKRTFEREWLHRVSGYTDFTTAGMAESHQDMCDFVNKWRPKILRHQIYMELDLVKRERLAAWAIKAITENPVDGLYYVMLISHEELMDRWGAYERIANLPARINGIDLQFKDGRATWPSSEFENLEMAAVIRRNLVWTQGRGVYDVYAMIETDDAAHFESNAGIYSDSLANYWLVHYRDGHFVSAQKIPTKDILWEPNIEHAPFGRGHTLVFRNGKAVIINCITGEIVMTAQDTSEN